MICKGKWGERLPCIIYTLGKENLEKGVCTLLMVQFVSPTGHAKRGEEEQ